MKAELNKDVRIKRDQNSELLGEINKRIALKIQAEFNQEIVAIKRENDELYQSDKKFQEDAKAILRTVTPSTLLKVTTQVGKGSEVINTYIGNLQKYFRYNDTWFNFCCPQYLDNKPFTIGLSCLQSVEIL